MVRRHISDELKEMALSMSFQGLPDSEVHELTGISIRSLKRLRSTHRRTGEVSRKPLTPGRPRDLTSMQRQFLCDCIKQQPDMALAELQTKLRKVFGLEMSLQTVARTLQWEGYTMKTVRPSFLHCLYSPPYSCRSHGMLWSETRRIVKSSRGPSPFTTALNNLSSPTRVTSTG